MPCGDKRSKKENKTHKCSGKNLIGFPQGAPWGPRAGVERAAAQPGAQEHTKAAATWHMGARPGTDRDAGSAGPLPPDSLFKAVRGRERPAAVEQARSAEVVAPQTQAALPRPVSDCCILSTHYACRDDPLTTRPWDGQTDTRLSCCRQAHPVHPHPLGREGAPGELRVLEVGGTARPGVVTLRKRRTLGTRPTWPAGARPILPAPGSRGPSVTCEHRRVLKTWSGERES